MCTVHPFKLISWTRWPLVGSIVLLLGSLLGVACQNVPANNPFDPKSPEATQATGRVIGRLLTSEASGDLEGATVSLLGTSFSTIVECIANDESEEAQAEGSSCSRARFAFTGIPAGQYQLSLSQPCFSPRPFALVTVGIGEVVDLRTGPLEAQLVRFARGLVSGEVDGPPEALMSNVQISDGRGMTTFPDSSGHFRIEMPACRGRVHARLAGYESAQSIELDVPVEDELVLEEPLLLRLEPIKATLIGQLEVEEGTFPETGVELLLESTEPSAELPPISSDLISQRIAIEEIPAGRWRLTISHPNYRTIERDLEFTPISIDDDPYDLGTLTFSIAYGAIEGQVDLEAGGSSSSILVELLDGPSAGLQQQANSSGAFSFPDVRAGTYRLEARAEGYLPQTLDDALTVESGQTVTSPPLTLSLNPGQVMGWVEVPIGLEEIALEFSLGGEITRSQNDRSCDEEIDCIGTPRCTGEGATRTCVQPAGFFHFERVLRGDYSITVAPVDDARLRSLTFPAILVHAGEVTTVSGLTLERAYGGVSGELQFVDLDEDERIVEGGLNLAQITLQGDEGSFGTAPNLQTGLFDLSDLPVGQYVITVTHPDYLTLTDTVSITAHDQSVELGVFLLEINPAEINGQIIDEAGQPISGVSILANDDLTETNSEGLFSLTDLKAGLLDLEISATDYASTTYGPVRLIAGESIELSPISLNFATGTLYGEVILEERDTHSGVLIRAVHLASGQERLTLTDSAGAWTLDSLRVGTYTLTSSIQNYISLEEELEVLEAVDREYNFSMSYDRGCIQGALTLSDGNDRYEDVSITLQETVTVTQGNDAGRFQFDDLIPGVYTIEASADGYADANAVVTITPGLECDTAQVALNLRDQQSPEAPTLELGDGLTYTPLPNFSDSPAILATDWNERGRLPLTLSLNLDLSDPFADLNFNPLEGLGAWYMRINGSADLLINVDGINFSYQQDESTATDFSFELPLFTQTNARPLSESWFIKTLLSQSEAELSAFTDEEITSLVDDRLDEMLPAERQLRLNNISIRVFNIEIFAVDQDGNRSDAGQFSVSLDHNPPVMGNLLVPQDCHLGEDESGYRTCYSQRETLSLQVAGRSTDISCLYLIEMNIQNGELPNVELLNSIPIEEGECLDPSGAHLISPGEGAQGRSLFCFVGLDSSSRVAIPRSNDLSDHCLIIERDTIPPSDFEIYPNLVTIRGGNTRIGLISTPEDQNISHYELRNITIGDDFDLVLVDDAFQIHVPRIRVGELNEIQVRAVDLAGNFGETVSVYLMEDSVKLLGEGTESRAVAITSQASETIWLNPRSCELDGDPDAPNGIQGRECTAKFYRKDAKTALTYEETLPPFKDSFSFDERHTFTPSENINTFDFSSGALSAAPYPFKILSIGTVEQMSIVARFESMDIDKSNLYLVNPTSGQNLLLVLPRERSQFLQQENDGTVTLRLNTETSYQLKTTLLDTSMHGNWTLEVRYQEKTTPVELIDLYFDFTTSGDDPTRCVIACSNPTRHTGLSLEHFQLTSHKGGRLFTHFAEVGGGRIHQARYWSYGIDDEPGTADDRLTHLDDGLSDVSPVIGLAASEERLIVARATEENGTPPGFKLFSFKTPISQSSQGEELDFPNMLLKKMSLFGGMLWIQYEDHDEVPPKPRTSLWHTSPNGAHSYFGDLTLSAPYEDAEILYISTTNARLIFLLQTSSGHIILQQVLNPIAIAQTPALSGEGTCDCTDPNEENQLCLGGYCHEVLTDRTVHINCSESPEDTACFAPEPCGTPISLSIDGDNIALQLRVEVEVDEELETRYRAFKGPFTEQSCNEPPRALISSREPLEQLTLRGDRLSFINQERAASQAYDFDSSLLRLKQRATDDELRAGLQVGERFFIELQANSETPNDWSLFMAPRESGHPSEPVPLPETVDFNGVTEPLRGHSLWAQKRGYKIARSLFGEDEIYVAVQGAISGRTALLRATLSQLNAEEPVWEKFAQFAQELNDFEVVGSGDAVLVMAGLSDLDGPVFLQRTPQGWTPWRYENIGMPPEDEPDEPCDFVAMTPLYYTRDRHLLVCASDPTGGKIQLHFAEISMQAGAGVPTLYSGQNYINKLLAGAFNNETEANLLLGVYTLTDLKLNILGGILLELKDDEARRLYYSQRTFFINPFIERPNGSVIEVYDDFDALYSRLVNDNFGSVIFNPTDVIFADLLISQEPEIIRLSLNDGILERLSRDGSPQYGPATDGVSLFWYDERYLSSDDEPLGICITERQP